MIEVREFETKFSLWNSYRDELITTGMTLSLVAIGSFIWINQYLNPSKINTESEKNELASASPQASVLGVSEAGLVPPTPIPLPTIDPAWSTVAYGDNGSYENNDYKIEFKEINLIFDPNTKTKRKVRMIMKITNLKVFGGITPSLAGSIVKDGKIITSNAKFTLSNRELIPVGENREIEATLSLIESTDVRKVTFSPGSEVPTSEHFLYP